MKASVHLRLLESTFAIHLPDDVWAATVELLWEPFLEPAVDADYVLTIEDHPDGWSFRSFSGDTTVTADPWLALHQLRGHVTHACFARPLALAGLHSAVVAGGPAGALLLAGAAKSGKTTLTLELLALGRQFVSDDMAPIDPTALQVVPFPKPLHVRDPDLWLRFVDRWSVPSWLPEPRNSALIPPQAFPYAKEPVSPRILVFPTFAPDLEPSAVRLPQALAVARCAEGFQNPIGLERAMKTFVALCQKIPAFSIQYRSSQQALDLLEQISER